VTAEAGLCGQARHSAGLSVDAHAREGSQGSYDTVNYIRFHMSLLKAVEEELRGVPLSPMIRPPVDFNEPNEELAVFAMRLYAYSSIAHIRTILGGLVVLDDAGNTPSAEVFCRHVFEWTAHASYMVSNLEPRVEQSRWAAAFQVVSQLMDQAARR
jgi:hypothetical protein